MGKEASFDFSELIEGGAQLISDTSPDFIIDNNDDGEEVEKNNKSSLTKSNEAELIKKDIEYVVGDAPDDDQDDDGQIDDDEVDDKEKEKSPSSKDTKDASGSFALAFAKFQQEEGVISEFNEEELNKVIAEEGEVKRNLIEAKIVQKDGSSKSVVIPDGDVVEDAKKFGGNIQSFKNEQKDGRSL